MMTDDQIIAAIREGNNSGASGLMKKYKNRMFYFIYSMVHNTTDAEDLTMISIQKACSKIDQWKKDNKFITWLFTIARNTVIDHVIANKRQVTSSGSFDIDKYRNTIKDDDYTPQDRMEHKESAMFIERCINQLPRGRRELMNLHIDGYKDIEISQILGISHIAVRTKLSRTRCQLKKLLKDERAYMHA
jgi:RNA polymerase sigma factor (sigma-70 family)